ncbi:hypothetical protein L1987_56906 [Smallanthus sonchifolius]|uniref:Uncharacterized protein n=1 Tax=Smallanthus sonchifolius TaxID=185202 RepID=A0ACB9DB41_9ASTR|nr:hypothetical protein L1987_56906 [Smallanthus sonchifolius]
MSNPPARFQPIANSIACLVETLMAIETKRRPAFVVVSSLLVSSIRRRLQPSSSPETLDASSLPSSSFGFYCSSSFIQRKMSIGELASTYACLILSDDGIPITAEKIATILKAAKVDCESYWPSLFAKLADKKNIEDLIVNVGAGGGGGGAPAVAAPAAAAGGAAAAAPAPEEKKEEPKEESEDDDMGFSLFD